MHVIWKYYYAENFHNIHTNSATKQLMQIYRWSISVRKHMHRKYIQIFLLKFFCIPPCCSNTNIYIVPYWPGNILYSWYSSYLTFHLCTIRRVCMCIFHPSINQRSGLSLSDQEVYTYLVALCTDITNTSE